MENIENNLDAIKKKKIVIETGKSIENRNILENNGLFKNPSIEMNANMFIYEDESSDSSKRKKKN